MMKVTKRIGAVFAAGVLAVVGLVVWPGCIIAPLPVSRQALSEHSRTEFAAKRVSALDRSAVVERFGEPDKFYEASRVAVYRINTISQRRLWLFLGVLPLAAPRDADRLETALIQYDERGAVVRSGIVRMPTQTGSWEYAVKGWLKDGRTEPPRRF